MAKRGSLRRIRSNAARRLRNRYQAKTTRNAIKKLRATTSKVDAGTLLNKVISMLDRLAKKNIVHKFKVVHEQVRTYAGIGDATINEHRIPKTSDNYSGRPYIKDVEIKVKHPRAKTTTPKPAKTKVDDLQNSPKVLHEKIKEIEDMLKSSSINVKVTHGEVENKRADLAHKFTVIGKLLTGKLRKGEKIVADEQAMIDQFNSLPPEEQQAEFERLKADFYAIS